MAAPERKPVVARTPDSRPKRDVFDVLTLLVGGIGAAVVVVSLVTTLQGGAESDRKAATALQELTKLADEAHIQQKSLYEELKIARDQFKLDIEQLSTLQESSNSLKDSANAERKAALASALAAQTQSEALNVQNKQLLLTFRPLIRVLVHDILPMGHIEDSGTHHDVTWEVKNIGSVSAEDVGTSSMVDTYPNILEIDLPKNVMQKIQDGACRVADLYASQTENEIAPQESVPQIDKNWEWYNISTNQKSGEIGGVWFGGCVTYKGIDAIIRHVRFSYVFVYGPTVDGKKIITGLAPTLAGNYSY